MPEYTVYFDTNAAFSPKPDEPISTGFLEVLSQIRQLTSVVTKVPSVVVEEICYQKTQAALKAAENQRKNAETIQQVSGIAPPNIPDLRSLKTGCSERLQDCLVKGSIVVIDVPVKKINWQRVIESACWRVAPFERPKSDDDLAEKGFRDCLIIEAIVHDAELVTDGRIAVLSKDEVFARGLRSRAGGIKRPLELYKGCRALLSELKLLDETQSSEFASAVLENVGAVFYKPDDPTCVAFAHKLLERLRAEYEEGLSKPTLFSLIKSGQAITLSEDWLNEITEWAPVGDLKINATPPEFVTVDKQGRYHWKSELTLARLLRRTHSASRQHLALPEEKIRTQKVDVLWSADINPGTAEFTKTQIDELRPIADDFVEATWQLRTSFNFPSIPGIDSQ